MKKSRHVVGLKVSETLYAPELTIPWHEHEKAGFCFVMEGAYEERFGRRRRDCDRGVLVLHPAGEQHADRHRNATVRLLNVEFDCNRLRAIQDVAAVLHDSLDLRGPEFMRFGLRLEREFRRSDTASDLALEALVLEVLASTARIGIDVEDQKPIWLRRVIEEIEVRPSAGHTMRSLAAKRAFILSISLGRSDVIRAVPRERIFEGFEFRPRVSNSRPARCRCASSRSRPASPIKVTFVGCFAP